MVVLAEAAKRRANEHTDATDKQMEKMFDNMEDVEDVVVDETKLANLVKRTKVYGDVVQGETEES